jgi:D-beta-D-heptose 7-phosphate kinase/D-beta-D-heptose 1-phosphate adenosyltransferase
VERISPEAPVPVLRQRRSEFRPGGAGSVVRNLVHLGASVSFFSTRGPDADGEALATLLGQGNTDLAGFIAEEQRRTTVKTRFMGYVQHADRAQQQILRVDDEVHTPVSEETVGRLYEAFSVQASQLDAVLISDYNKGLITAELIRALRLAAPDLPFLVDPAVLDDYELYRGVYLICPNRYEAARASGLSCNDTDGCARAARHLIERFDLHSVALTMDRDGIYLIQENGVDQHFPTRARRVSDVTGAGDMVLSVLGLAIAGGGTLEAAVDFANVAAGLEVRRVGVTPLSREEILSEARYQGNPAVGKIKKVDELLPLVEAARNAGRQVVFTNGCFDLLHRGHHHLLHGASSEGDLLIVALNSDASVRRLKGEGRPAISQEDRTIMLADLEVVDYVTCFDDDTPIPLLESLRPDVLVKGEEYRDGVVVGREVVEGYGGRIAYVAQLPGFSTTGLLGKNPGR